MTKNPLIIFSKWCEILTMYEKDILVTFDAQIKTKQNKQTNKQNLFLPMCM